MIGGISLQANVFLPTIPPGLDVGLTFTGILLVLYGHIENTFSILFERLDREFPAFPYRREAKVLYTVGFMCLTVGVLLKYQLVTAYMALLYGFGRMIEGVAAVRFWRKIHLFLTEGRLAGNTSRSLMYKLAAFFVVLLGGSLMVELLLRDGATAVLEYQFALVWTAMTLLLSLIGLSRRVLPLTEVDDEVVSSKLFYGYILAVAGASIFDASLVTQLAIQATGTVAYTVGFWLAVFLWVRGKW